jgi:autotransporter-associated beta strand protein
MNDTNRIRISAASASSSRRISNRSKRAAALAIASAATVIGIIDVQTVSGTVLTFTATAANATWTGATNWSPSQVPGINDDVIIPAGGNLMWASTAATTLSIRTFAFNGSTTRTLADGATAAGANDFIQFNGNGVDPIINITNTGSFSFQAANGTTGTGTLGLVLNTNGDIEVANAAATLTLPDISEINASRSLTINGNGGAGTVMIGDTTHAVTGGTSTFTGGINIVGGALVLNTALSTNGTVPNRISFSGGKLELNNGVTISGLTSSSQGVGIVESVTGANTLNVTDFDAQDTYSGQLRDGSGTLNLTHGGNGTLELSGDGTSFTGTVTNVGGTLYANHLANPARKLGNGSNSLIMSGGTILLQGNGTSPGPEDHESFTTTALNASDNVFQVIPGGNLTSIDLGTISHGTTATADFRVVANGGGGQITTSNSNDATGILGPWATYLSDDWAMVNGTGQIVPFQAYAFKDDPSTWAAGDHVSYSSSVGHVGASTVITSLRMDPNSFPFTEPTLNIDGGATLTIGNGGILNTDRALFGTITGPGTLTSGTNTLIVHTNSGGVRIDSTIANNTVGSVTVIHSGIGVFQPTGTNTYTGDTVVNSGSIMLDPASTPATLTNKGVPGALGAGNNIVLNNGTLTLQAAFANNPQSTDRDVQIGGYSGIDIYGIATFSGLISDPSVKGSLNLTGTGQIYLTNSGNSYRGGTRINGAYVVLPNGDTLGNAAGSVLMNGGTLIIASNMSFPSGRTFVAGGPSFSPAPINISGSGTNTGTLGAGGSAGRIYGTTLVKGDAGTFAMGLNVINTCTKFLLRGGDLAIAGDAQLGPVPATLVPDAIEFAGGTLRFFSNSASGFGLSSTRGMQVDSSGTLDFAQSSGTAFIPYPISGFGRLYKNGPVTVSSNVSHSFSGGLDIVEGRWNVTTSGAAGTGSIIMEAGSAGASPRDGSGQILTVAQLGIGSLTGNINVTLSNDILLAPIGSGVNSFEVNTNDNLTINGVISGTGGLTKGAVAATTGTLTLGNASNSYSGATSVVLGAIRLGASNVIPDTSAVVLTLGATGGTTAGGILDVNGKSDVVGSVATVNPAGAAATIDLGTGGALTTGADNTSTSFAGIIQGSGSITKIGTGTQTFRGSNTYTGLTTVVAGNLTLTGSGAQSRVVTGGGADIQGGRIVFSDTTNSATIKSLLTASYQNNGFNNTNQIRSTTATNTKGLGFVDDGTKVTVAYTFYGDGNLDGTVNTGDFNALAANFNATGKSWVDGDFNYDGIVNALDFNAVASNFGSTLPAPALSQGLGTLVPEPGMLALAAVGLLALRRRKHRKMQ